MAGPYYVSAAGDNTTGTSWATAKTTFAAGLALSTAGDTIYVNSTHNENTGADTVYSFAATGLPVTVISTTVNTTTPALGAAINSNGNFKTSFTGFAHLVGMTLTTGAGASSSGADFQIGSDVAVDTFLLFDDCNFTINSSNVGAHLFLGSESSGSRATQSEVKFNNCTFKFGATGQQIKPSHIGRCVFSNCNIDAAGSQPTTLFIANLNAIFNLHSSGCDWSGPTNLWDRSGDDTATYALFSNCKIPSTVVTGTAFGLGSGVLELQGCSSADNNWEYYFYTGEGSVIADATVYLTTGSASQTDTGGEATPYSLKMTPTTGQCSKSSPLYTPWMYYKLTSTGSKTFTVCAADTEAAVLTDSELWLEVDYMGGAAATNVPQSQLEVSAPLVASSLARDPTAAGSNLTDTGVAWTGIAETGTYSLAKTVTVDEQGYLRWRVGLGKVTTNPVYVDMKLAVA